MSQNDEKPRRATNPRPYTRKEDRLITRLYPTAARATILAKLPGRTWFSIRGRAADQLRLTRSNELNEKWRGRPFELLQKHYPSKGADYVANLLGEVYTAEAVRGAAKRHGIALLQPGRHLNKRAVTAKPKLVPQPASEPPKPALAPPVKRAPATPNLNAQKAIAKAAAAPKPSEYVKAEQVRKLPASHPARLAYTRAAYHGPAAATKAFHEAMKAAA